MPQTINDIQKIAYELRSDVISMLYDSGSGHSASSLGTAEIFSALYFSVLDINPNNFNLINRDKLIVSGGHICPIWYATLAKKGFIDRKQLFKLRQTSKLLQGHPNFTDPRCKNLNLKNIPGVENNSGSLGQGLSIAIGMAISYKMQNISKRIYCITGDGELNEGQIWEGAMFASNYPVDNLTWIIDCNGIQLDGTTKEIMSLNNLKDKLESFNWYTIEIDGHNVEEVINSLNMSKNITQRPTVILAHTIPGKGVEFMEYKFEWHGKTPNKDQKELAIKMLNSLKENL